MPIARTTAVMLEGKDTQLIGSGSVVDRVGKTRYEVSPDLWRDEGRTFGSPLNRANSSVNSVEQLRA